MVGIPSILAPWPCRLGRYLLGGVQASALDVFAARPSLAALLRNDDLQAELGELGMSRVGRSYEAVVMSAAKPRYIYLYIYIYIYISIYVYIYICIHLFIYMFK